LANWETLDLNYYTLAIDSEFLVSPKLEPISIQFILSKDSTIYKFVVLNEKYQNFGILQNLENFQKDFPEVYIGFDSFLDSESPLIKHMLIFFESKHLLVNLAAQGKNFVRYLFILFSERFGV
jgi:hypothetical protein